MTRIGGSGICWSARAYIALFAALGLACFATADWHMEHGARFACYLAICIVASALKVNLPGILGTMSVNFLFILIGVLDLGAGQTMVMGCLGALVQVVWKPKHRVQPVQAMFSVMNIAVAIFAAYYTYHWPLAQRLTGGTPALLILASLTYFLLNTSGVAGVVALTERKSVVATWRNCYFWSFPFYLVGASIAWVFAVLTRHGQTQSILLLLPVIYVIYRSYRMYLAHLEDEKKHVEEMAALGGLPVLGLFVGIGRRLFVGGGHGHGWPRVFGPDGASGHQDQRAGGQRQAPWSVGHRAPASAARRTASPESSESDGSRITASPGFKPETTSTRSP